MKHFVVRCLAVAALGAAAVYFAGTPTPVAANADEPTIKDVMQRANGKDGVCKALGTGLKVEEPKWDDLHAKAKELVPLAKAMEKQTPPKGTADSWKKFTTAYTKAAEDLEKATAAKDAKSADAAMKVLANCTGCHTAHRVVKKK